VLLDAGAPRAQGAAVRVTAADGAWVELSTSGAVVMAAPESGAPGGAGPRGAAWRVVLPTGALAAAAPDACMTVLHADGCASVRLPRGWAHADRAWAHNDNARARAAPPPPYMHRRRRAVRAAQPGALAQRAGAHQARHRLGLHRPRCGGGPGCSGRGLVVQLGAPDTQAATCRRTLRLFVVRAGGVLLTPA